MVLVQSLFGFVDILFVCLASIIVCSDISLISNIWILETLRHLDDPERGPAQAINDKMICLGDILKSSGNDKNYGCNHQYPVVVTFFLPVLTFTFIYYPALCAHFPIIEGEATAESFNSRTEVFAASAFPPFI